MNKRRRYKAKARRRLARLFPHGVPSRADVLFGFHPKSFEMIYGSPGRWITAHAFDPTTWSVHGIDVSRP